VKWNRLNLLGSTISLVPTALGQSNINPNDKFGWAENAGWTNWRDANATTAGVQVGPLFLSGYVWAENVGWINVGDGTPAADCDGIPCYNNVEHTDYGVNIDPLTGELYGMAWGENVGWINFTGGALADPPNPARIDLGDCRLRGFAWAENVGWINLDDADVFVAIAPGSCTPCPGDFDGDGVVGLSDLPTLVANLGGPDGAEPEHGDLDADADVDLADFAVFAVVFGPCPL